MRVQLAAHIEQQGQTCSAKWSGGPPLWVIKLNNFSCIQALLIRLQPSGDLQAGNSAITGSIWCSSCAH